LGEWKLPISVMLPPCDAMLLTELVLVTLPPMAIASEVPMESPLKVMSPLTLVTLTPLELPVEFRKMP
jgi:hypothetical protein